MHAIFTRLCKQEAAIFFLFHKMKPKKFYVLTQLHDNNDCTVSAWSSYDQIFKMLNLTWALKNVWGQKISNRPGEDY